MDEMASQRSELWPQERAYTLKPAYECKFKLRLVKAATHYDLYPLSCPSGLCVRGYNKAHFTAFTASLHTSCTAHNRHTALVFSSSWLCLLDHFIKLHSVKLQEQNFTQTSGSLFSESTVSKGQVKIVCERKKCLDTPLPYRTTCISHRGPEVRQSSHNCSSSCVFSNNTFLPKMSHLKEHRWPSLQPFRPGNPQTHSQFWQEMDHCAESSTAQR